MLSRPVDWPALLHRMLSEPGFAEAAAAFALRYADFNQQAQADALVSVFEHCLASGPGPQGRM